MPKAILFDLDGTLTESAAGITRSVAYACEKLGAAVPEQHILEKFIGPPLIDSFMEYYGMSQEEAKTAVAYYREYFRETGLLENVKYDGVDDMLARLKAIDNCVCRAISRQHGDHLFAILLREHLLHITICAAV